MTPKIVTIAPKKLIGFSIEMSLLDNQTQTIWQLFMPRLKEITNAVSADLFSLQKYPSTYFTNFTPETIFSKWAAVEVKDFEKARNPSFQLKIDFGVLGTKNSAAQITVLYSKEELIGRQVIAVVNFPPKQIANFFSECLVLGVYNKNKEVILLQPSLAVENADKIG